MPKQYNISFYTGGVDIDLWHELPAEEQKAAISKAWYLRWYFRNPKSGKMEIQQNWKGGVNRFKTKEERLMYLNQMKKALQSQLEDGLSPYDDENWLGFGGKKKYTVKTAIDYALSVMNVSERAKKGYRSHANQFLNFIGKYQKRDIKRLTKDIVIDFLNDVLKKNTARTRNNTRSSLSAIFTTLERQLIIDNNFIRSIHKERTKEKVDRTFSTEQLRKITGYLRFNDPQMLLFIKFVSYNFLRPVEVCRLKIKDINLEDGLLYFNAKNKPTKIKRIPDILLKELRTMKLYKYDDDYFLFTPGNKPDVWDITDHYRREHFTKRFKKHKDKMNLDSSYGIYSFRHSFITNLFQNLRTVKGMSFNEAVNFLMVITGHDSKDGLTNYLHKIDADIPADWSGLIDIVI